MNKTSCITGAQSFYFPPNYTRTNFRKFNNKKKVAHCSHEEIMDHFMLSKPCTKVINRHLEQRLTMCIHYTSSVMEVKNK